MDERFLPAAAFEASVRSGSVALAHGERAWVQVLDQSQSHARDLLPTLQQLLRLAQLEARDLRTLVVGTGPGSFTGLRVAIATAQGLARAIGAKLVAVPSLEALAAAALLRPGDEASILVDAFGGAFYRARYARRAQDLELLVPPAVHHAEELLDVCGPDERLFTLADSQAVAKLPSAIAARVELLPAPMADVLLERGRARLDRHGPDDALAIEPLYLRPFAAKPRRR